jgi:hypothetical protein
MKCKDKQQSYFTEYKLAAIWSATLSRAHDFPPSVVLNKMPLPPAAQASFCSGNIIEIVRGEGHKQYDKASN